MPTPSPRPSRAEPVPAADATGARPAARLLARAVFWVALAGSAWLLLRPSAGGTPLPVSDKVLHAGLFLVLGLLGWLSTLPRTTVLLVLLAWAPLSELLQHLLPTGRTGDPLDLLADLAGLALAALVAALAGAVAARSRRTAGVTPR
ncbi:hypothetical protein GC722_07765 [Auraticoccus sp. F435]|uniref:VanZ family protein n=1 Tax=Auraticoccus cholistanensis TaxID=2656650 RepID=A0A6A9UXD0_9ACTN|nr:hypothetical protein [Auraticoccus cholistanensis]MVA75917.1 hypothetical protein [Auraticoccus cholistanensis]